MNMDFMHFHIMSFFLIKDSMIILCDNIDIKENFLKKIDDQIFLCILNYDFFIESFFIWK